MLYNLTYNDPKITKQLNEAIGTPFSLFEKIKKGGIGSPKLFITRCSATIFELLQVNNSLKFCNIELRPKGILIGFQSRLDVYGLAIPYYKLVVFKPGTRITFHIDHHYISIDGSKNNKAITNFMAKLEREKEQNTLYSPLDAY